MTSIEVPTQLLVDAGGRPMPLDSPAGMLMVAVATDLIGAGFKLHDCGDLQGTGHLGGVCLTPLEPEAGVHDGGVRVTWTQHRGGLNAPWSPDVQAHMDLALIDALGIMDWPLDELFNDAGNEVALVPMIRPKLGFG